MHRVPPLCRTTGNCGLRPGGWSLFPGIAASDRGVVVRDGGYTGYYEPSLEIGKWPVTSPHVCILYVVGVVGLYFHETSGRHSQCKTRETLERHCTSAANSNMRCTHKTHVMGTNYTGASFHCAA